MREFFCDEIITIPYKLFGKTHIFLMLFLVISLIIIYINRKKITALKPKTKRTVTLSIAITLLLNMVVLYTSSFYYGIFDIQTMLPLHLCYISNYLYIFSVIFQKEKLYPYAYFLCFLGPLVAIILFDVPSVWESYNFYLYVISHHVFLIGGFLTYFMYPKEINKKHIINLFITLNILYILINIFNHIFNTNYFFTDGIPDFVLNLMPFLKYIPTVISLEVCELSILFILYYFYKKSYLEIMNRDCF